MRGVLMNHLVGKELLDVDTGNLNMSLLRKVEKLFLALEMNKEKITQTDKIFLLGL